MLTLMLETAMLILVQSLGRGVVPFQGSIERQYDFNLNKDQGIFRFLTFGKSSEMPHLRKV